MSGAGNTKSHGHPIPHLQRLAADASRVVEGRTGARMPIRDHAGARGDMKAVFEKKAGLSAVATAAAAGIFKNAANTGSQLPRDPTAAFELVERVLKAERLHSDGKRQMHTVFVIDYAERLFPSGSWGSLSGEDRHCIVKALTWARDTKISSNANPIVLVADSAAQINENITASASRIEMLEVMLPSPGERRGFIDYLEICEREKQRQAKQDETGLLYEKGFDANQFAHLTAGLKKVNIEDIKLTAAKRGLPISPELVKIRKKGDLRLKFDAGVAHTFSKNFVRFVCVGLRKGMSR